MNIALAKVKVGYEQDVVHVRKRAQLIAEMLGFDRIDQTRIATAVSEIARNAQQYGQGGEVEFLIESSAASALFMIVVRDRGPGISDLPAILENRYHSGTGMGLGIIGSRRLLDHFQIESRPGQGTTVTLGKLMPAAAMPVTPALLSIITKALAKTATESPLEEIRRQNQELLSTLELLRQRDDEVMRINRQLLASNVELRLKNQAVEQSPESIVITGIDARIEYVNTAFEVKTGYSREEAIGRNPRFLQSGKTPAESHRAMWAALTTGYPWKGEFHNRRKNGSEYIEFATVTPISRPDGLVTHYVAVKEDVTDKKRLDDELDDHRHHLEQLVEARTTELEIERDRSEIANQAKSTFLANMSHEIRTPINAILGFAYLCLRLDLPPRERDYLNKIHSASSSLLALVNDILDAAKMDAGMLAMESIAFALNDVLANVASLINLKAREKGLELVIAVMPDVPDRLQGDPHRLGQVLNNLLGNALKFTEKGKISLTVERLGWSAEEIILNFNVSDTGLGMTQEQQATVFAAFAQADNSTTRKYGGTGLGLTICTQLVELMGGKLELESEPGLGSCFSFSGHFAVPPAEAAVPRSALKGKKVLVVEDNQAMRTLFAANLKNHGCQVETLGSGEAALLRLQSGDCADLVLLDWHLPGIDGLATARILRSAGNPVPIVLITGDDLELARSQVVRGDIQGFLGKPFTSANLYDTLAAALCGREATSGPSSLQKAAPDLRGCLILLVDDNDFNRQVGRELLEFTGAEVVCADDGAQAVTALQSRHYDLVLMDLQMPVLDGYGAARIIRQSQPELPIIALTAHAMEEERARVLAAGMNDIITKPILPELLYATLARHLSGQGQRTGASPIDAVPVSASPRAAVFDQAQALARVNGSQSLLERFLRLFRERNSDSVAEIGAALARQDLASAQKLTHALKGVAGTVGMVELQEAATSLDKTLCAALAGSDEPGHCGEEFSRLTAAWARAQKSMVLLLDSPDTQEEIHNER